MVVKCRFEMFVGLKLALIKLNGANCTTVSISPMPAFTRSSRFQTFTVSEKEAANALLELKRGMNVQTSIATTRPRRACTVGVSYAEDEEEFQQAPSSRPRRACAQY